jgi:thiamine-phosphate pyrophosphorylase
MHPETAIRSYLITDPAYYGSTPESVAAATASAMEKYRPDFVCFRDKQSTDYAALAAAFVEAAKVQGGSRVLLHSDAALAAELGADGVHLPSNRYDAIREAKALGLYVVASCHSLEELQKAAETGADAATYSPVFASPGKGNPKGLEDLKEIVGKIDLNIFALGGITTPEQVEQVAAAGAYGFASIRYFS